MKSKFGKLFLILFCLLAVLGLVLWPNLVALAGRIITIDGSFGDWSGLTAFATDPNDAGGGASDARAIYVTSDGSKLYLRAEVWGTYSIGIVDILYIDTDYTVATGYNAGGWTSMGAEYRIVHTTAGFTTPTLQVHTGGNGSDTWNTVTTLSGAFSGSSAEYAVPYTAFSPALTSGRRIGVLFRASQDAAPHFWSPQPPAYTVESSGSGGGATATRTRTNTPGGPTATRTRTPTAGGPTPTRTRTPTSPPSGGTQKLLIPSYFYPCTGTAGCYWDQLNNGAPTVGIALINPASGPGSVKDQNYADQTVRTQSRGIKVLGYVHTSYTNRPAADVKREIDLHYTWYNVDGIFFDEVQNVCTTAYVNYYQDLYNYVKGKSSTKNFVILNPGTNTGECYMPAADVIAIFESAYSAYLSWAPSAWVNNYPASRFWHLVYGTTQTDMPNAIALSKSRRAGWIYITPDLLPNPWDTLPTGTYWTDELFRASH